jgi:hypothetical protein
MLFLVFFAGCGETGYQTLYLNLYPIGIGETDPFAGVSRLEAALDDGTGKWKIGPPSSSEDFGPLRRCDGCRIEVTGYSAGARLSWGFSPALNLLSKVVKTSLFFTPDTAAVAHAGPPLVDPNEGLIPAGVPESFIFENARGSVAYNRRYLYVDLRVLDDVVIQNDDNWYSGDLVVLAIDGMGDSAEAGRGIDDVVVAFGAAQFAEQWHPQNSPHINYPLLHSFNQRLGGYDVFAAVPIDSLTDGESPGPGWKMKLGIYIQDVDQPGEDPVSTPTWPPGWNPLQNPQATPPEHYPFGSGDLVLKPRLLDARRVTAGTVGLLEGIDDFLSSGAVPLAQHRAACEDNVMVYALWDSSALMLAIESADRVFCARQLMDGDRANLVEFDAVEVTVVRDPYTDPQAYRAVFSPAGGTSFDRMGAGAWDPGEIYFRFDLDGPRPSNDCREGNGYTFWVRIPWRELGYLVEPPDTGELFGFDLAVYDNDRGARSQAAFSPMGPTEDPEALGELRLFEY